MLRQVRISYYDEKVNSNVHVKVCEASIVTLAATCEKSIPVSAVTLAVLAFQFPNSQNSRCVPVASHAAKNTAIVAAAPENAALHAAFLVTSTPRVVSHAAGAVVSDPTAM